MKKLVFLPVVLGFLLSNAFAISSQVWCDARDSSRFYYIIDISDDKTEAIAAINRAGGDFFYSDFYGYTGKLNLSIHKQTDNQLRVYYKYQLTNTDEPLLMFRFFLYEDSGKGMGTYTSKDGEVKNLDCRKRF